MPNTKSAARRARNSARKRDRNRGVKARIKSLQKQHAEVLKAGSKEDADKSLRSLTSALDRAAKGGVIHKRTADRRKSRLTLALGAKK